MKMSILIYNNIFSRFNNQKGSTIVISLMILVVLTLIGISATNTSVIELKIAGNEKVYRQNFNLAEAAAMEAVQKLQEAIEADLDNKPAAVKEWLKQSLDGNYRDDTNPADQDNPATWDTSDNVPNTRLSAVEKGIDPKSSHDMTATSNMYDYAVRGYSNSNSGEVHIEIGYRRRH
ncbi:MAG: pilus assembly PilX N-terminal domain-containing protein [Desulfamplus sp.]|nr:pilus assembly PilX N-terminal domain-containing protein [Desulfamplus sp.]